MAKFKVGDRVKYISGNHGDSSGNPKWGGTFGKISGEIVEMDSVWHRVKFENGETNSYYEDDLELITDYQPITPKVGEKYRVVKDVKDNTDTIHKKGTILEAISNYSSNSYARQKWKTDQISLIHFDSIHEFQLTTEYLELVEEATIKEDIIKPLKQKAMKALKKLTQSKEDRTLERAGFIDSCGEPTEKTTDILLAKLFVEKKDELVKMAEEELAEDKE